MPIVKLYANLRKLAGTKELSVPGSTVRAVLSELVEQYPPLGAVILENGELRQHIVVTINGHNAVDLDAPLMEQDVVAVFPPMAGG
jgi:MoaD family protein